MTPRMHRHAALIKQWLDDDSLKVESLTEQGKWAPTPNPYWHESVEYRFKPRTIRIGEYDVPEPMRVAPELNAAYWVIDINQRVILYASFWNESGFEQMLLKRGVMHDNKKAAELHAKALISLTEEKE